jgi:hypothetical protein
VRVRRPLVESCCRPVAGTPNVRGSPDGLARPFDQPTVRIRRISLDVTGTAAATICAVHCVATPFLLAIATLPAVAPFATVLASPLTEWAFVITSALLGATSLIPSFTRVHRDMIPCGLFIAGLGLLICTRVTSAAAALEPLAVPVAALLMIGAHVRNRRQCARCRACAPTHSLTASRGT